MSNNPQEEEPIIQIGINDDAIEINDDDVRRGYISIDKYRMLIDQKSAEFDRYATNKSVSQDVLNFSTFQQQIGLILSMFIGIQTGITPIQIVFCVFVGLSIIIEIVLFVFISKLAQSKKEQVTKKWTATSMNNMITILSFLNAACNFVTVSLFSSIAISNNNNAVTIPP